MKEKESKTIELRLREIHNSNVVEKCMKYFNEQSCYTKNAYELHKRLESEEYSIEECEKLMKIVLKNYFLEKRVITIEEEIEEKRYILSNKYHITCYDLSDEFEKESLKFGICHDYLSYQSVLIDFFVDTRDEYKYSKSFSINDFCSKTHIPYIEAENILIHLEKENIISSRDVSIIIKRNYVTDVYDI